MDKYTIKDTRVYIFYTIIALIIFSLYSTHLKSETADNIDNRVREISTHLMCPVCAGQSVAESNAQLAKDMRATIRQQLMEGKSKEQILNYFTERYGDTILSSPPPRGINILIWVLPTLGIILVGLVLGNYLYKTKDKNENLVKTSINDSEFKNIEDELNKYDI